MKAYSTNLTDNCRQVTEKNINAQKRWRKRLRFSPAIVVCPAETLFYGKIQVIGRLKQAGHRGLSGGNPLLRTNR